MVRKLTLPLGDDVDRPSLTDEELGHLAYMYAYHYDIPCTMVGPLEPGWASLVDLGLLTYHYDDRDDLDLGITQAPVVSVAFTDEGRRHFAGTPSVERAHAFISCGNYLFATFIIRELLLEELSEFLTHGELMIRLCAQERVKELCDENKVAPF